MSSRWGVRFGKGERFRTPVAWSGPWSHLVPGVRVGFLAFPSQVMASGAKRRAPRRPGPAGLRARTSSALEGPRPAAALGSGSAGYALVGLRCATGTPFRTRPVTASLGATSLSLRSRVTHRPRGRTQGGLVPNHRLASLKSHRESLSRGHVLGLIEGEVPLCLASRTGDCRVGLAWTRARGSPGHDVASNRPVRNPPFARLIVADAIRGDQARRAKASGCPSFRRFSWTSKKIDSHAWQ